MHEGRVYLVDGVLQVRLHILVIIKCGLEVLGNLRQ